MNNSAKKWNGDIDFQCISENCDRYKEIKNINISELESYQARVQRLCRCGHTRQMHDHRISESTRYSYLPKKDKDVNCKTGTCNCCEYL